MGKYYIAYGSNMDLEQMANRCPNAELIGTGWLEGYGLIFRGSKTGAYATIEPRDEGRIPVLVWKLGYGDEERLDRYEGYPAFYRKEEVEVAIDGSGGTFNAMVYIMDENRVQGKPSEHYYQIINKAYGRFCFDKNILREAYKESVGGGN